MQLSPAANATEIKTAFRRLAHIYHPDKNNGNKYALAYFELIKEAYETLSKPQLKEQYLQERWLSRANGQSFTNDMKTPEGILQKLLALRKIVQSYDAHRFDKKGLYISVSDIFSKENIDVLRGFNDTNINKEVIFIALQLGSRLHPKDALRLTQTLLTISCDIYRNNIIRKQRHLKNQILWNTYQPYIIILLVIVLCIFIWMMA